MIKAGSASLTPTQSRYGVCEIELLGIVLAAKQCQFYLQGLETFEVVKDHRPLLTVLHKDMCNVENLRLHRFREKIAHFNFEIFYIEGK